MHIPTPTNPRKRPAPGTTPTMPMPVVQPPFPSPTGDPGYLRWGGADGTALADPTIPPTVNSYGIAPGQHQQFVQPTPASNNALARRQMNRALVPTATRPNYDSTAEPWSFVGEDSALLQPQQQQQQQQQPQPPNGNMTDTDNVEILEEMARKAMREAQQKRKQIPPFVQKLSSFLDDDKNSDLIRWSEKGDSFIVLDEDEFAKKLIPDLFKHNNYASFVRQLNMYGFHKRVGLSDNSMRASERKNKSPSEYSNPYFRRGHPNLLWLINKPKGNNKGKKGAKNAEVEGDSEEDATIEDGVAQGLGATSAPSSRALPPSGDMPLQKKEMAVIREELNQVRDQQRFIMSALQRIQQDNTTLYNQAVVFQNQHDRHQNSINAILNFLANVFRKTLEDQAGAQSVNDLLASIIPNSGNNSAVPQGSVVDLGDFIQAQSGAANNMNLAKRRQALLPPIPQNGRANTVSPSPASSTPTPQPYREMGTVTELFDNSPGDHTSPTNYLAQQLETNPHDSMMKIINNTNANSSSGIDLPEMVNNTPATMSNDQRNKMLNIMAGRTSTPASNATPSVKPSASPRPPAPSVSASAEAPPMPSTSGLSLSPIMEAAPSPPRLQQISNHNADAAALRRMQEEQALRLEHIASMLGPLSPSGRIPGIDENGNVNHQMEENGNVNHQGSYFGGDLDMEQFLNPDAFQVDDAFPGVNFNGDGNDFNFTLDGATPNGANAAHTPSSAGTEEIPRDGFDAQGNSPDRGNKRRRVG
ncbi:HSF-type DNA-binding protein [Colletotrichum sojae]|uniref:HSF-type DNA-binding protein n=1 Tax=Colletotrichum sojae TaxID=2175907 RepID=A0A8H6JCQ8_9PEZI|nr:HSF-type DNA-binding protein [Colletotrichum sojae]